jgi:hypothetical protein
VANTPIICGWNGAGGYLVQVGSPGNYSMGVGCGSYGLLPGGDTPSASERRPIRPSVLPVGPGPHPASFFGETSGVSIYFSTVFFQRPDCTGVLGSDSLSLDVPDHGGHEVSGVLAAPPGTRSALFAVGASSLCANLCALDATFDNLDVTIRFFPFRRSPRYLRAAWSERPSTSGAGT